MTPRFFVDGSCESGREVILDADDAYHAHRVLRMRAGDGITIVCNGMAWDAVLTEISSAAARAKIVTARSESGGELPAEVTVMQALIKGAKFDFVVEKVVELGARRIIPVRCERCESDASSLKLERWRRIARSAAAQARRRLVPAVDEPISWTAALNGWPDKPAPIVAYEAAQSGSFAPALSQACAAARLAIAIGPEGGLAPAEVETARRAGCALVSLGPTVLRTETAALAMLAALAASCEWW